MPRPDISEEKLSSWEERFQKECPPEYLVNDNEENDHLKEVFFAGFWIKEETECPEKLYPILALAYTREGVKGTDPWRAARIVVEKYKEGYYDPGTRFMREFSSLISKLAHGN